MGKAALPRSPDTVSREKLINSIKRNKISRRSLILSWRRGPMGLVDRFPNFWEKARSPVFPSKVKQKRAPRCPSNATRWQRVWIRQDGQTEVGQLKEGAGWAFLPGHLQKRLLNRPWPCLPQPLNWKLLFPLNPLPSQTSQSPTLPPYTPPFQRHPPPYLSAHS